MFKSVEEFQTFSKEGFEAYVAAATAMTKGLQNIATESADYSRKSFEKGTQAIEKVMAAKSVEKALELQQGFLKDSYESFLSQVTRFNELYANALKEAYKPFEAQVAQVTSKVSSK